MQGNNYLREYGATPSEGSTHTYRCELNKSTGQWAYYSDTSSWKTFTDAYWQNKLCDVVDYSGEIYNEEDDMAGTSGDKCNFTNCQYRRDGQAWQVAGITANDVSSSDSSEWGVERVSSSAINIWDKNPN
jgi:hypothetical protein